MEKEVETARKWLFSGLTKGKTKHGRKWGELALWSRFVCNTLGGLTYDAGH